MTGLDLDLDFLRARTQARAEQMLQELLDPEMPAAAARQDHDCEQREAVGPATAAIEELAIKAIRRQYWLFGSELSLFHSIAALQRQARLRRYEEHLTAIVTGLVADGMASGEFSHRHAGTAARAFVECLGSLMHPLISRRLGRQDAELRARAQVRFIAKALA